MKGKWYVAVVLVILLVLSSQSIFAGGANYAAVRRACPSIVYTWADAVAAAEEEYGRVLADFYAKNAGVKDNHTDTARAEF